MAGLGIFIPSLSGIWTRGRQQLIGCLRAVSGLLVTILLVGVPEGIAAQQVVSGSLPQQVVIGSGGALEYSVPIPIVPGTAGMQPTLSLAYNSQGPSGPLGAGWSIGGVSQIARGPRDLATDGASAAVDLSPSDALYFDGQRLIPIARTQPGGTTTIEYRKELDDQSRIVARLDSSGQPRDFVVRTRAGLTLYFGTRPGSRVQIGGATVVWLLERISDRSDNYMGFTYLQAGGDHLLESVSYTGHKSAPAVAPYAEVRFDYEQVQPYSVAFVAGKRVQRTRRLNQVRTRMLGANPFDVFTLALAYDEVPDAARFQLREIRQSASDGSQYRPLSFRYSERPATPWTRTANFQLPVDISASTPSEAFRFVRIRSDPVAAPALAFATSSAEGVQSSIYESSTTGWSRLTNLMLPTALVDARGRVQGVVLADVDGDGRDDILAAREEGGALASRAWLQSADAVWTETNNFALPLPVANADGLLLRVLPADVSGDGKTDLIAVDRAGDLETLVNSGSGWQRLPRFDLPASTIDPAPMDVDCDGQPEVLILASEAGRRRLLIYRFEAGAWVRKTGANWEFDLAPASDDVMIGMDARRCGSVFAGIRASGGTVTTRAFIATATIGLVDQPDLAPPQNVFWDSSARRLAARSLDLNGDNLSDLIVSESWADGSSADLVYLQLATPDLGGLRWRAADGTGEFRSPFRLARDGHIRTSVHFRPLDAGATIDTIDLDQRGPGQIGGYLNNGTTWAPAAAFSPPLAFARHGADRLGVHFVDLNSDGLVDIVYNRRARSSGTATCADGTDDRGAFINRGNRWECVDGYIPPLPLPEAANSGAGVAFLDVNNDGFVDLVYSYRTATGNVVRQTHLNGFPGGQEAWSAASSTWQTPVVLADERLSARSMYRLIDVNGDARVDIVRSYRTSLDQLVTDYWENNGQGWQQSPRQLPAPFVIYREPFTGIPYNIRSQITETELIDIDGDRNPDMVERYLDDVTGQEVSNVYRWNGTAYVSLAGKAPFRLDEARSNDAINSYFMDINGDGLVDFYRFDGTAAQVHLGTGSSWQLEPPLNLPPAAIAEGFGDAATRFMDLNGDGLLDLGYHYATGPNQYKRGAFFNLGTSWAAAPESYAPTMPFFSDRGEDMGVRPLDVDGNGLPDLVRSVRTSESALSQDVWLNLVRRAGILEQIVDGSGVATRVAYQSLGEYRSLVPGETPGRLYEHGRASAYPSISIAPAMYVVARLVSDEGNSRQRATRFRYGDLRLDVRSARSLGFAWKETIDEPTGIVTRTEFEQNSWLTGVVRSEVSSAAIGGAQRTLSTRRSTWSLVQAQGLTRPAGGTYAYARSRMDRTEQRGFDLDGSDLGGDATDLTYDRFGNSLTVRMMRSDGSGVHTANSFGDDPEAAWLGRLSTATVRKFRPGHAADDPCAMPDCELRRSDFTYEAGSLLLETEVANAHSTRHAIRISYERDPFGNVARKTTTPLQDTSQERVENFVYADSLGRRLASTANSDGTRTSNEYGDRLSIALAIPTASRDPNGLSTRSRFDGFGRAIGTTDATGLARETRRLLPQDIPAQYLVGLDHANALRPQRCSTAELPIWRRPEIGYAVIAQQSASGTGQRLTPEIVIYDRAGRVIRQIVSIFDGTNVRLAFADMEYDDLGRLRGRSLPYFSGQSSRWLLLQYDRIGRVMAATEPDGSCTLSEHSGLTVMIRTFTRAGGTPRNTTTTVNLQGGLALVRDAMGGTIQYQYDAGERVTQITGPTGARILYRYDEVGNRSRIEDADTGVWTFEYDAFSRLTAQRHASTAAQPRTVQYDSQGRIQQITTSQYETRWTYRGASLPCGYNRIERVERIAVNGGPGPDYREDYGYDQFCRASTAAVTITSSGGTVDSTLLPTTPLRSRVSYDGFGRPETTLYPRSFAGPIFSTRNIYHAETGALIRLEEWLPSDTAGRQLWSLAVADAAGRVTQELRGRNLRVATAYNTDTGRVSEIAARLPSSRVFEEDYRYDGAGNLVQRTDADGLDNNFLYDDLDRLTTVREGNQTTQAVAYDPAGRILSRRGLGFYRYGSACGAAPPGQWRPTHAVCAIAATQNGPASRTYRYDARGNLTLSPTALFEHDPDGRVVRTTQRDLSPGASETAITQFREQYAYGPAGDHYMTLSSRVRWGNQPAYRSIASYSLGLYHLEVRRTEGTNSIVRTDRWYLRAGSRIVGFVESADYRSAAVGDMPDTLAAGPAELRIVEGRLSLLVQDRLGSVRVITNEAGQPIQRFAFDPWGRTTSSTTLPVDVTTDGILGRWSAGFTDHQHLAIGTGVQNLIHMGARLYDAELGVFLSPDPLLSDPTNSQDLNPYMYVTGNSLRYTDPSGQGWLSDFFDNPLKAIENLHRNFVREAARGVKNFGRWIESDWREIVAVGVGVVIVVYCPPCMANPLIGGFIVGAAQAGTATALYGGDASQVLEQSLRGGAIGAVGGAASYAAGSYIQTSQVGANSWQAAAAHGVAGGTSSLVSGGRFETGFVSGALTQAITHNTRIDELQGGARVAANAALGGVNAEIGGGSFANGAMYSAYQVMFNDWLHPPRQARVVPNKPEPDTVMPTGVHSEMMQCTANCIGEDVLMISGGREEFRSDGTRYHSVGSAHPENRAIDIPYFQPGGRQLSHERVMQCAAYCGYTRGQFEMRSNDPRMIMRRDVDSSSHWHLQFGPRGTRIPKLERPIVPPLP